MSLRRLKIVVISLFSAMMLAAIPAFAQIDFSGEWTPNGNEDSIGNPYVGDWLGIPMSDASRARSEAWAASVQTLPEWQCRPHGFAYIYRGPSQLHISKEVDPVTRQITAFHAEWLRSVDIPIYLGRIQYRRMGGRYVEDHDDSCERRISAAQWRAAQ